MRWQYRTISWEKTSILYNLSVLLGPKTHDYISFYGLRSHGRLFEGGPVATSQVLYIILHYIYIYMSMSIFTASFIRMVS